MYKPVFYNNKKKTRFRNGGAALVIPKECDVLILCGNCTHTSLKWSQSHRAAPHYTDVHTHLANTHHSFKRAPSAQQETTRVYTYCLLTVARYQWRYMTTDQCPSYV